MPRLRGGWLWRWILFVGLLVLCWLLAGVLLLPLQTALRPFPLPWSAAAGGLLAAAGATALALSLVERAGPARIWLHRDRRALVEASAGFGLGGAIVGGIGILLLLSGGLVIAPTAGTAGGAAWTLVGFLLFFSLAAAAEELVFRGYALRVALERIGPVPAVGLTAAAFAAAHAGNPGITPLAFVNLYLVGILLGALVVRTRALWTGIGVHTGWNWTMAGPLDLPVSGLEDAFDTPGVEAALDGPWWWTGGEFGPEGGVAATLLVAGVTGWTLLARRLPSRRGD